MPRNMNRPRIPREITCSKASWISRRNKVILKSITESLPKAANLDPMITRKIFIAKWKVGIEPINQLSKDRHQINPMMSIEKSKELAVVLPSNKHMIHRHNWRIEWWEKVICQGIKFLVQGNQNWETINNNTSKNLISRRTIICNNHRTCSILREMDNNRNTITATSIKYRQKDLGNHNWGQFLDNRWNSPRPGGAKPRGKWGHLRQSTRMLWNPVPVCLRRGKVSTNTNHTPNLSHTRN